MLNLETLEDRNMPAICTWNGVASTDWLDASNWVGRNVPNQNDEAVLGIVSPTANKPVIPAEDDMGLPVTVHLATLTITPAFDRTLVINGDLDISGNAATPNSKLQSGAIYLAGGTLEISGVSVINSGTPIDGSGDGTLFICGSGSLTMSENSARLAVDVKIGRNLAGNNQPGTLSVSGMNSNLVVNTITVYTPGVLRFDQAPDSGGLVGGLSPLDGGSNVVVMGKMIRAGGLNMCGVNDGVRINVPVSVAGGNLRVEADGAISFANTGTDPSLSFSGGTLDLCPGATVNSDKTIDFVGGWISFPRATTPTGSQTCFINADVSLDRTSVAMTRVDNWVPKLDINGDATVDGVTFYMSASGGNSNGTNAGDHSLFSVTGNISFGTPSGMDINVFGSALPTGVHFNMIHADGSLLGAVIDSAVWTGFVPPSSTVNHDVHDVWIISNAVGGGGGPGGGVGIGVG